MSDDELAIIKRKKLLELQRRLNIKEPEKTEDANEVLNKVFKGRAWEVFNSAYSQYPETMGKIKDAIAKAVLAGKITQIDGEELYTFLKSIGLRVRLNTEIHFVKDGKMQSLSEKLKGDYKKD